MPAAEVRHPNEVSPGDFLSAADVEIVRNVARHRSVRKNVQIVRVTARENVLGAEQVLSAGNVRNTFNLEAEVSDCIHIYTYVYIRIRIYKSRYYQLGL